MHWLCKIFGHKHNYETSVIPENSWGDLPYRTFEVPLVGWDRTEAETLVEIHAIAHDLIVERKGEEILYTEPSSFYD